MRLSHLRSSWLCWGMWQCTWVRRASRVGAPLSAPGISAPVPVVIPQAVAADAEVLVNVRTRGCHCTQRLLEQRKHLWVGCCIVNHLPHDANVGALRTHRPRSGSLVELTGSRFSRETDANTQNHAIVGTLRMYLSGSDPQVMWRSLKLRVQVKNLPHHANGGALRMHEPRAAKDDPRECCV